MSPRPAPSTSIPAISLRGGNALDDGVSPPPFDAELDMATAGYLEANCYGIPHLDPDSWRYYLPIFCDYTLKNITNPKSMAVDQFLASLLPPDRDPPRLESLDASQRTAVVALLDQLAFRESSAWKSEAMAALEQYWAPGALYRKSNGPYLAVRPHARAVTSRRQSR